MKYKLITLILLFTSCTQNFSTLKIDKSYNSKGFAYIYNEKDFIDKIIKKKLDHNTLQIAHNRLRPGSLIKITNIKTKNNNNYAEIPFPSRNLLPIQKYFSIATKNNPITTLVTAKGCPFRCVFCYTQKKVLYRETKDIVEGLKTNTAYTVSECTNKQNKQEPDQI